MNVRGLGFPLDDPHCKVVGIFSLTATSCDLDEICGLTCEKNRKFYFYIMLKGKAYHGTYEVHLNDRNQNYGVLKLRGGGGAKLQISLFRDTVYFNKLYFRNHKRRRVKVYISERSLHN